VGRRPQKAPFYLSLQHDAKVGASHSLAHDAFLFGDSNYICHLISPLKTENEPNR